MAFTVHNEPSNFDDASVHSGRRLDPFPVRLTVDEAATLTDDRPASNSRKNLETFWTREERWTEAMRSAFALTRYGATAFACICEGWLAEP